MYTRVESRNYTKIISLKYDMYIVNNTVSIIINNMNQSH